MRIAIVGFDVEGRASYDYFLAQGHELEIRDQNEALEVPEGVKVLLGGQYLDRLSDFDLIVRTAGLPPHKILEQNPGVEDKITTLINEFFKASPTRNIIGVTGTKGKGTTSSLIAKMLEAAGKDVYIGGNIGVPPLTFLSKLNAESWIVLELSSFQLIDLKQSPKIAVCLMVVPEHLNWHADMTEYVIAKSQLFTHQVSDDIAIYFGENELSEQIASNGSGQKIPYFIAPGAHIEDTAIYIDDQVVCKTADLNLLGVHNYQNVCAAVTAVWQVTQDLEAVHSVLTTFSGLEHRLELVRELNGVRYFDDSFGTTPETATVAIQAFDEPKVLILGGADKGADYSGLAKVVSQSNMRTVLLIGEQADRLQAALEAAGFHSFSAGGSTMPEIVATAKKAAQPGDIILLSTACTSFDMFKNYKDRGEQFKKAVANL